MKIIRSATVTASIALVPDGKEEEVLWRYKYFINALKEEFPDSKITCDLRIYEDFDYTESIATLVRKEEDTPPADMEV